MTIIPGIFLLFLGKIILSKNSILVSPTSTDVSDFCTKLTTITKEMLIDAVSFKEMCKLLKSNFGSIKKTMMSWGPFDRLTFERQCEDEGEQYPFGETHINLKQLFAIQNNLEQEIGMKDALKLFNIELEGTHHRGIDDAYNISKIFFKMFD